MLETLTPHLGRFLDSLFDPAALEELRPHLTLPQWTVDLAAAMPVRAAGLAVWIVAAVAPLLLAACTRAGVALAEARQAQ